MTPRYLVYLLFGLLLGCSGNGSDTTEPQDQDNVFNAQTEALNKAKAVETQIQDAAAKQRQAIDDQGR